MFGVRNERGFTMSNVDLLWLVAIAGVWFLLGTKRRREQRRWNIHHGTLSDGGAALAVWGLVILAILIIAAFH